MRYWFKKYSPSLIFGGKNSIPGFDEIKRIAGSDRYETSLEIAREFNSKNIVIASGENFPDALSGALVAKKKVHQLSWLWEIKLKIHY